jgi:hypothetical protein
VQRTCRADGCYVEEDPDALGLHVGHSCRRAILGVATLFGLAGCRENGQTPVSEARSGPLALIRMSGAAHCEALFHFWAHVLLRRSVDDRRKDLLGDVLGGVGRDVGPA